MKHHVGNILEPLTTITTWKDRVQACITAHACVLGTVCAISHSIIYVSSTSCDGRRFYSKEVHWTADWEVGSYCKTMILRMCQDYVKILIISLPPPMTFHDVTSKAIVTWQNLPGFASYSRFQVMMIWDWMPEYDRDCQNYYELLISATDLDAEHLSYSSRFVASARLVCDDLE
jgi:hypothetical protein